GLPFEFSNETHYGQIGALKLHIEVRDLVFCRRVRVRLVAFFFWPVHSARSHVIVDSSNRSRRALEKTAPVFGRCRVDLVDFPIDKRLKDTLDVRSNLIAIRLPIVACRLARLSRRGQRLKRDQKQNKKYFEALHLDPPRTNRSRAVRLSSNLPIPRLL